MSSCENSVIIRSFLFAASIFTLLACQSAAPKPVDLTVGTPVSAIIERYGNPASSQPSHYIWSLSALRLANTRKHASVTTSNRGGVSSNNSYNPQVIRVFCKLEVTTDDNRLITGWNAEGDGCKQILFNQL